MNWRPQHDFESSLAMTIEWYRQWIARQARRVAVL
jgi:dTDP-D-glucose 4,6-dehydratase